MENIDTFFKNCFNKINVENVNELYPENDLRDLLIHIYKNIFGSIIENETKYMTSNSSIEDYIKLEFERNENLTKEVITKLNTIGNISILERVAIIANTLFLHQIFTDGNSRTMFILIKILLAKEGLNFTPNIEETNIKDIFGVAYFDEEIPTDDIMNFIKNNTNNLKKEIN